MGAWNLFKDGIFWVIHWIYTWCGDWGLAIVIITIAFRMLIYPITRKQFRSSYQMQKLQPKLKEIKEKYPNDPQRQNQEQMNLYKESNVSMFAGCLPMILQMPIFIALFQVLRELEERIGTTEGVSFYGLVPDLTVTTSQVFFEQGVIAVIPYALMLILFAASMIIPVLLQKNAENNMKIMMGVMSVVMLWFGVSVPAGVLLYWDISSYIGVGQQQMSRIMMQRKDEKHEKETEAIKPVKVEVDRVERKARPKKKR